MTGKAALLASSDHREEFKLRQRFSIPSKVAATISVVAATFGLAAVAVAGATTPVELTAGQTFCSQVNAERSARGLGQLHCTYNGAAQSAAASHTDSTDVWMSLVANPATATVAFMQSADHRWWIVDPTATTIDIGVACVDYGSADCWTERLMGIGANLPDAHGPDGAPPPGYVTQPDTATPCGVPTPPSTSPPPTAAPAKNSPSHTGAAPPAAPEPPPGRSTAPSPAATHTKAPTTTTVPQPPASPPSGRQPSPQTTTVDTRAEPRPLPDSSFHRARPKRGTVAVSAESTDHHRESFLPQWWWGVLGAGAVAAVVLLAFLVARHRRFQRGSGQ